MEETGQNPWGERTKKMKLKGRKKKNKNVTQELQKIKKAKIYSMGKNI